MSESFVAGLSAGFVLFGEERDVRRSAACASSYSYDAML